MVAVWFLDKLCTLSFRPGSFIPLLPAQRASLPPLSYHYILLAQQSVSESLFLSMTTMNSWTHYRQNILLFLLHWCIICLNIFCCYKLKSKHCRCKCENKAIFDSWYCQHCTSIWTKLFYNTNQYNS